MIQRPSLKAGAHAVRRRPATVPSGERLLPFLGIPFVERGRDFDGADCRGLHLLILEELCGVHVPEPAELYRSTSIRDAEQLRDFVAAEARRWRLIDHPEPYAALLFGVPGRGGRLLPGHVGTHLGGSAFLHTQAGYGVQVADLFEPRGGQARWAERLLGVYVYDC